MADEEGRSSRRKKEDATVLVDEAMPFPPQPQEVNLAGKVSVVVIAVVLDPDEELRTMTGVRGGHHVFKRCLSRDRRRLAAKHTH